MWKVLKNFKWYLMYMYLPHTDVVFLGILLKCSESQEELCIITHSLSLHSKNKTLDGWQKKYTMSESLVHLERLQKNPFMYIHKN